MIKAHPSSLIPSFVIRLVVGLGNPGSRYQGTRHNLGANLVNHYLHKTELPFSQWSDWKQKGLIKTCEATLPRGQTLILARPLTYMNESGEAVSALVNFFRIASSRILICYDEMDLPLGEVRIRLKGSAGGHKGMESVVSQLGTQDVPRLRLGIGPSSGDPVDFVLGCFSSTEQKKVQEMLTRATEALECVISDGIEKAMNQYNHRENLSAN
ncbi:MAG: aminoacyl-tRNA hydrolase [Elusimicrobia bacterium]|nr:aminoacyl-tRNA hydrolase [Elusimicrobiota bacterium]